MFPISTDEPIQYKELSIPTISYSGPLKKAVDVAQFYGFNLLQPVKVSRNEKMLVGKERKRCKEVKNTRLVKYDNMGMMPEEKISIINWYLKQEIPTITILYA